MLAVPDYRRDRTPGGTYFFTVTLRDRQSRLLIERIDALRDAVRGVRLRMPFEIVAWAVMPDHMHAVWQLPRGDDDYPSRWRAIKARFTRGLAAAPGRRRSLERRREKGIWQRRYWEHRVRDSDDLRTHIDYVHFNPVKHGLCDRVVDWPYSTFHRYVSRGDYPGNWGISDSAFSGSFGEPAP